MTTEHGPDQCARCGNALPAGIRLAFFVDAETDDACLGSYCCVEHAFQALDDASRSSMTFPDTLYLGVRIDRDEHDKEALRSIMTELARRAAKAAMEELETELS